MIVTKDQKAQIIDNVVMALQELRFKKYDDKDELLEAIQEVAYDSANEILEEIDNEY